MTLESISMVDPVIDEHFRRSLGADYVNLYGKRMDRLKTAALDQSSSSRTSSEPLAADSKLLTTTQLLNFSRANGKDTNTQCFPNNDEATLLKQLVENIDVSVDDHFAKALGDTWKQLQQNKESASASRGSSEKDDDQRQLDVDGSSLIIDENAHIDDSSDSYDDSSYDRNSR